MKMQGRNPPSLMASSAGKRKRRLIAGEKLRSSEWYDNAVRSIAISTQKRDSRVQVIESEDDM